MSPPPAPLDLEPPSAANPRRVMLFGRPFHRVARAPFRREHYRSALAFNRTFEEPVSAMSRYVLDRGSYPWTTRLKTPTGPVAVTLGSSHDVRTVTEIFCRGDYGAGADIGVVVDIGANIGLAALHFLAASDDSFVYCFEPDPRNLPLLRENLAPFAGRFEVTEAAVSTEQGEAPFVQAEVGRYSALASSTRAAGTLITVRCVDVATVVEGVLATHGHIDVVKIDTEGNERDLVAAIPARSRARIHNLYHEANDGSGIVHLTPETRPVGPGGRSREG